MVGCPTCGAELTFIEPYGRHYCYGCRSYAPRTLHACPDCNRALVFVQQYRRHYCYGCQTYREGRGVRRPCPGCGDELAYLPQYDRFYCYACRQYAPRAYGITGRPGRSRRMSGGRGNGDAIGYAPFSREELDLASKDQLVQWCREYGVDDSGMKYELRLRILEQVRKRGLLLRGEEADDEGPPVPEEAPPEEALEDEEAVAVASGGEEMDEVSDDEGGEEVDEGAEGPAPRPSPPRASQAADVAMPAVRTLSSDGGCRNCGGELTHIPQYGRWYCYACRTYAPAAEGGRPAAHPGGGRATLANPRAVKVPRGGNPMVGLSLAAGGVALFVAHMLLFKAPAVFDLPVVTTAPEVAFALEFLSLLFIALGLMAAILLVRSRT